MSYRFRERYLKLSVYDSAALAIAKCRDIILLTGDGALRKAAMSEGVQVMGTIGIVDRLAESSLISEEEYIQCLSNLLEYNGGKVRLPRNELEDLLRRYK